MAFLYIYTYDFKVIYYILVTYKSYSKTWEILSLSSKDASDIYFADMSLLLKLRLRSKGLQEIPTQATLLLTTCPFSMVSVKVHLEICSL